jgi:hypothetical protein
MGIKEGYESYEKRFSRASIYDLEEQIESLRKEIYQLQRREEELEMKKEGLKLRAEKLELSINIYQLIEQKDVRKIKKLLLSKFHKKVLRILFMYYDQQESEITFLYDQFDHTFQFRAPLRENEERIFEELIFKLRKPPTKHKAVTHLPDSEWYAQRKSKKEQGES